MNPQNRISLLLALFPVVFALSGCIKKPQNPDREINLYIGVRDFVQLEDTENLTESRLGIPRKMEIPKKSPEGEVFPFTEAWLYPKLGVRIYWQNRKVVLIEFQEPFRGKILGKNLPLFTLQPNTKKWDEQVFRALGEPVARSSGGRLGSEGFFYTWGDISFNKTGINELALYRDPSIARFRIKYFGRQLFLSF